MAKIQGSVPITGVLAPTDSLDNYAVTDPIYGIDGLRSVASVLERNSIATERRREGMIVYTRAEGKYWKLNSGLTNNNWSEVVFSAANGSTDLSSYPTRNEVTELIDNLPSSGGGGIQIPKPKLKVVVPREFLEDSEGNPSNSHDKLFATWEGIGNDQFLSYDAKFYLFRYKRVRKYYEYLQHVGIDVEGNPITLNKVVKKLEKRWTHPTHQNGTNNLHHPSLGGQHYYQTGAFGIGDGSPVNYDLITPRSTEFYLPQDENHWAEIGIEPNLWFTETFPITVDEQFTNRRRIASLPLIPDYTRYEFERPDGSTYMNYKYPFHKYAPTGHSWNNHQGYHIFRLAISIINPEDETKRIIGPYSDPFKLIILPAWRNMPLGLAFRYLFV